MTQVGQNYCRWLLWERTKCGAYCGRCIVPQNLLLTPETFVSGDAVKRAEAGKNKLAPSEQIVLGSKVE